MKPLLLIPLFVFLLAPLASGYVYPVKDGQYLSILPDSVATIILELPGDAGVSSEQGFVYSMRMSPDPNMTWSDFSFQSLREVSANNTASIAINFDTTGKVSGECASPYELTLVLERGDERTERVWRGGVCCSEYEDVDYVDAGELTEPGEVMDAISSNPDLFDIQIEPEVIRARPREIKQFTVTAGGHRGLEIVASFPQIPFAIEPLKETVSTSEQEPFGEASFSLQAPASEGEYEFSVLGTLSGCSGDHCRKTAKARLIVSGEQEEETGFSVSMFPENINTKDLDAVVFRYTITNSQNESGEFHVSMSSEPAGASSTFEEEDIEVPAKGTKTSSFSFTPTAEKVLYKIKVTVSSGEESRTFVSTLSTDEMLTDPLRERDSVWDELSSSGQSSVSEKIIEWKSEYESSTYEESIEGYSSLQETIDTAKQESQAEPDDFDMDEYASEWDETQDEEGDITDLTFFLIVALVLGGGIGIYLLVRRMRSVKKGDGEFQEVQF